MGNIIEKSNGTFISYFEGQPREKELTDEYWDNVEKTFKKGIDFSIKIEVEIGKTTGA